MQKENFKCVSFIYSLESHTSQQDQGQTPWNRVLSDKASIVRTGPGTDIGDTGRHSQPRSLYHGDSLGCPHNHWCLLIPGCHHLGPPWDSPRMTTWVLHTCFPEWWLRTLTSSLIPVCQCLLTLLLLTLLQQPSWSLHMYYTKMKIHLVVFFWIICIIQKLHKNVKQIRAYNILLMATHLVTFDGHTSQYRYMRIW